MNRIGFLGFLVMTSGFACGGYEQQAPEAEIERRALAELELERWEAEHGPAAGCWAELELLRWEVGTEQEVAALCRAEQLELVGCMAYVELRPVIMVTGGIARTAEQLEKLRRHELRHWLLICSDVDPFNRNHDGPYWEGLL